MAFKWDSGNSSGVDLITSADIRIGGGLAVGSVAVDPADGTIRLVGTSDPNLVISESNSTTSYAQLIDMSTNRAILKKVSNAGVPDLIIEAIATNGTSAAVVRFGRETNTTGEVRYEFNVGDGTATIQHKLLGNGHSHMCMDNNYMQIGQGGPTSPFTTLTIDGGVTAAGISQYQLHLNDTTAFALGVGGAIVFGGKISATPTWSGFGAIKGIKENATSNNYAGALVFSTRINGGDFAECGRFSSTGAFQAIGSLRATGSTVIVAGSGLEVSLSGYTGYLQCYNRTDSVYLALIIRGLTVAISPNNITNLNLGYSSTSPTMGVLGATAITRRTHIVDANGTLTDITTKFNTLLAYAEQFGFISTS